MNSSVGVDGDQYLIKGKVVTRDCYRGLFLRLINLF